MNKIIIIYGLIYLLSTKWFRKRIHKRVVEGGGGGGGEGGWGGGVPPSEFVCN